MEVPYHSLLNNPTLNNPVINNTLIYLLFELSPLTVDELVRKKARNEKKQTEKARKSKEQGLWEATDFKTDHYNWMEMFREEEFAQVNLDKNSSRIQILRHFLTDEFLKDVFDFYGPERFTYIDHDSLSTINHGSFSLPLTILYLSVYVLISAHHVVP